MSGDPNKDDSNANFWDSFPTIPIFDLNPNPNNHSNSVNDNNSESVTTAEDVAMSADDSTTSTEVTQPTDVSSPEIVMNRMDAIEIKREVSVTVLSDDRNAATHARLMDELKSISEEYRSISDDINRKPFSQISANQLKSLLNVIQKIDNHKTDTVELLNKQRQRANELFHRSTEIKQQMIETNNTIRMIKSYLTNDINQCDAIDTNIQTLKNQKTQIIERQKANKAQFDAAKASMEPMWIAYRQAMSHAHNHKRVRLTMQAHHGKTSSLNMQIAQFRTNFEHKWLKWNIDTVIHWMTYILLHTDTDTDTNTDTDNNAAMDDTPDTAIDDTTTAAAAAAAAVLNSNNDNDGDNDGDEKMDNDNDIHSIPSVPPSVSYASSSSSSTSSTASCTSSCTSTTPPRTTTNDVNLSPKTRTLLAEHFQSESERSRKYRDFFATIRGIIGSGGLLSDLNDTALRIAGLSDANDRHILATHIARLTQQNCTTAQCSVCKRIDANIAMIPCGHRALCNECRNGNNSNTVINRFNRRCPVCRKSIFDILEIF